MQELALLTKQIGVLKERIASLSNFVVYPNTNVTAAAATPYPAYVPVSAAGAPVSQPNATSSAPYSLAPPTKTAPAASTSPLVPNNAPSVPNQYPPPSTSSTTTVTPTMPARGIPRGPATLNTMSTTQLHKANTNGVLPPINPPANAPVYPSGGASAGPYPTQTPAQALNSSAITWKCQLCNTSNTSNVCSGCAIPRPAAQNTPPISPTPTPLQATARMVWMFAAVGTEIFCPYASAIQALLEQQFWKTKSLPAVILHTMQLGPDSVYQIKRQQNLLFQVHSSYRDPYPHGH